MKVFCNLVKYDPFQGIAYGVATAEKPDLSGEVMDYTRSKPNFMKWSEGLAKLSDGASFGNVHIQHDPRRVVGKLTKINFNDAERSISVAAKIVDPVVKELLRERCLTGFSIGGSYAGKFQKNGRTYYEAMPSEISVVDRPCLPEAKFSMVKDEAGTEELVKFASDEESEALLLKYDPIMLAKRKLGAIMDSLNKDVVAATPDNTSTSVDGAGQIPPADQEYCDCATGQTQNGRAQCNGCGKPILSKSISEGEDDMKKCEDGKCAKCADCMEKALTKANADYASLSGKVDTLTATIETLTKENKMTKEQKEITEARAKVASQLAKAEEIISGLKKAVMSEGGDSCDTMLPDGGIPAAGSAGPDGGVDKVKKTVEMQITKLQKDLAKLVAKKKKMDSADSADSADTVDSSSTASNFGKSVNEDQLQKMVTESIAKAMGIEIPAEPKTMEERIAVAVSKSLEELGVKGLKKQAQPYLNPAQLKKAKADHKAEVPALAKAIAEGGQDQQEAIQKMFGNVQREN